mmetsp:Transcript_23588/g.74071  ORF Transcript_23588/g.74071 Transcript_23588/m.74071 type:complete len:262 (-) Transcript_23588:1489-2274(-)
MLASRAALGRGLATGAATRALSGAGAAAGALVFRQLFEKESSTYTYLLGCPETSEAVLIDPVLETVERDLGIVEELGLRLVCAVNTHAHADHVTGTAAIKDALPDCKSAIGAPSGARADVKFEHGESIAFGSRALTARSTPGHTAGCMSLVLDDESMVFTGDTLLIRGCGRTDFQGGSAETLFASVNSQIFSLPDTTLLYPAHDYQGRTVTTVGEEKRFNPRLKTGTTVEDFTAIMDGLNLAYPKKIDVAVPLNMNCGYPV